MKNNNTINTISNNTTQTKPAAQPTSIPEKKKIGIGIGILLMKEGKILLGKRHDDPIKADSELHGEGTWTMPGGKLDYGETFEDGAVRETFEETGIRLNKTRIICLNEDKNIYAHYVTIGLYCDDFEGEPKVMEPDEITEWRWFAIEEMPKNLFEPTRNVLRNYLANKFYIEKI